MSSRKRDRWDSSSEEDEDEDDMNHAKDFEDKDNTTTNNNNNNNNNKKSSTENRNIDITSDNDNDNDMKIVASVPTDNAQSTTTTETAIDPKVSVSSFPMHNPLLSGCRSVYDSYERLARLDEGTYGVVWKAKDLATKEIVALKQIKFDIHLRKEGFPMAALREIGVLLALSHQSIVTVKEMVVGDSFDKVFMVMEYMEMDLQEATKQSGSSPFPQSELKSMLHQILSAMDHIHDKWILHRDIKTSNILVHKTGRIALCDFGLARKYQMPLKAMTQMVVTLWYRPPELLFGETVYGPEVDMWSVGCVFGELMKKDAILKGKGELDQIDLIFQLLGVPNETNWPEFSSLPNTKTFRWKAKRPPQLSSQFPVNSFSGGRTYLDPNGFDLLKRLLSLDPKKRITAREALDHEYFREGVDKHMPRFFL